MDFTNLLEYLFESDPKLKYAKLPSNLQTVDVSSLMNLLKDPTVKTIDIIPTVEEPSEMCLSVPTSEISDIKRMGASTSSPPDELGNYSQTITPILKNRNAKPISSTLKQGRNQLQPASCTEMSEMSSVPVLCVLPTYNSPISATNLGKTSAEVRHSPPEFIKRVIPIRRTFYLSYCVFDYWALFSGLYTSPLRLKHNATNERPRDSPYIRLIDEESFKETLIAMRANLNLPAAELIAIAKWMNYFYTNLFTTQRETAELTENDMIALPSFKHELIFLLVTLYEFLHRINNKNLENWTKTLYNSQFHKEMPSLSPQIDADGISITLLANLLARHLTLLASSLLEQLNKRFSAFFSLSAVRWQNLSDEIDKLYLLCKDISSISSFVGTSLSVSSLDAETGIHMESLSGVSDMANYHKIEQTGSPIKVSIAETTLPERLCLIVDAIFKIINSMTELAGETNNSRMIDRLALFSSSTCFDFIEELIRLLVQNMDTQCFYEECDSTTLHACWSTVNILYNTYIRGMLLKCKQCYGFVASSNDFSGLIFDLITDTEGLKVISANKPSAKSSSNVGDPANSQVRKRRKDHVLVSYDAYDFLLTILQMCDFRLVQDQLCYRAIATFLREHVQISDRSEVDEVCAILEPFISDYTGNFHSNQYGLRYILTLMHIVFAKYYESDDFRLLGLHEHCSASTLSKPEALYIYQIRLQRYLYTAIMRQLNRLYSQSEANAIDELLTCNSLQQYLNESLEEDIDVIEVDLNDLDKYTFQPIDEDKGKASKHKKAEKKALKEAIQQNCKPNPIAILSKLFATMVDQIQVDVSIHLPIFSESCFDNSIMYLEYGSKLSQFLHNVYISTSFCSSSKFVGFTSPQPKNTPLGSPLPRPISGLYSETHCELATETVVMEENSGKIRVSPISIYAGLIIKFINDKVSTALVRLSGIGHDHQREVIGAASPSSETRGILDSPEIVDFLTKIKFQEVKDMLKSIDATIITLGTAFYNFYTENKTYRNWMENHMRLASIIPAKHAYVKKSLSLIFPPDISIILLTPLLSFYITKEAEHISSAVTKIYEQETNLKVLPFNWLVTNKTLRAANEITSTSERCNSLHYNASSAPIDGIEPVLLFLESIFRNFHLSSACLRCLFSQILDLVRVILQPVHYNSNILDSHKMPKLMQLFTIDNILQSKNMMKQNSTKKSSSISTDNSLVSVSSECSFTSSSLSAYIIGQKGYKSSLDVASSVTPSLADRARTKYLFSWDVDNTGQDLNFAKNEISIGKLTIRKRLNSITLRARAYENKLSPEESIISSILPMGTGVPSGALMFSSCEFTDSQPPKTFSDIIQHCRVLTYRINSLEVLLARIVSVYEYLSENSVSYDCSAALAVLETEAPTDLNTYWIVNSKKADAVAAIPPESEEKMLLEYFQSIVNEVRSTITVNIDLLCSYLINTGLKPLLQRAYCPVVMQTQLHTAWSGLEITLKDIYRNIFPLYIKVIAETVAIAALNAHAFILLDSGPRARTIIPANFKVLNDDLAFLKDVLIGTSLCSEEYIVEYKRLFKVAHEHGAMATKLSGLYLSIAEAGADYFDSILRSEFVLKNAVQVEDLVRLHGIQSEELMLMGNVVDNIIVLEQLDTPKDLTQDVITHSEYIVRVLNFRRYSESATREWLHKLKKTIKK